MCQTALGSVDYKALHCAFLSPVEQWIVLVTVTGIQNYSRAMPHCHSLKKKTLNLSGELGNEETALITVAPQLLYAQRKIVVLRWDSSHDNPPRHRR